MNSNPSQTETVGNQFELRYGEWLNHVQRTVSPYSSSDRNYIENRFFDAMVDLGTAALPFIIEKLRHDEQAHFLIHALTRITGKQFTQEEVEAYRSRVDHPIGNQALAQLWLAWWDSQS